MDPVGQWSAYAASYNRLASASGGFQTSSTGSGVSSEFHHGGNSHQTVPSTSSQLLLQAAHTTVTLAGQPSPFNPGSFLSPPPVGYDPVFSPLFHHANQKQAHYVNQHRQALVQATKQGVVDSELTSLRENYNSGSSFFEHQANASPNSSSLPWSHQGNAQLPSPFGILPHETVVTSSPGPPSGPPGTSNSFNAHLAAAQSLNHLNSQIKSVRAQSPLVPPVKPVASAAGPYFHPTCVESQQSFSSHQQQSCIVSTAGSKEYRIPQPPSRSSTLSGSLFLNSTGHSRTTSQPGEKQPLKHHQQNFVPPTSKHSHSIQTKAQTKVYPELSSSTRSDTSQSSPISFAMMDATSGHRQNQRGSTAPNLQQFQHVLNQQQGAGYLARHYALPSASAPSENYTTPQNGPDCGVVVPRRPSPLQAHSQASPLGHVPSPAYPMYNSPMASPLQQHSSEPNQCVTNTNVSSPLDVTVPRPSSQGVVAYPSVITSSRNHQINQDQQAPPPPQPPPQQQQLQQQQQPPSQQQQQQLQQCWESERQHSQHIRTASKFPAYSGTMEIPPQQQNSRVSLGISERQQAYFDSTPGSQDLLSCRGDPMSIVKNLQTLQQQQNCQLNTAQTQAVNTNSTSKIQHNDERIQKSGGGVKRRKSSDKIQAVGEMSGSIAEYFTSRVPPPAHHNANQQQQNGGYFDFERWNLPPPPSKMFGSSPGAFGSQTSLHHSANFVGNAHQHQPLIVPHHHPPPPMPYFPAFQLHHPHHSPHEFQPSAELTPSYENPALYTQEVRDDQPKVIVPNIEEELGFLSEGHANTVPVPVISIENREKVINISNPSSGFMASYMKFLQGERDTSPPPQNRGGRKATWSRTKVYQPPDLPKPPVPVQDPPTNGVDKSKETVCDPQDDPRYFPLPKSDSKRKRFGDSDDNSSDSEKEKEKRRAKVLEVKVSTTPNVWSANAPKMTIAPSKACDKNKKSRTGKAERNFNKKRLDQEEVDPLFLPPRRETSRRKAKEKTNIKQFLDRQEHNEEEIDGDDHEFVDSDSDPAWTPAVKECSDDEVQRKRGTRRLKPLVFRKKCRVGSTDQDGYSSSDSIDLPLAQAMKRVQSNSAKPKKIQEKLPIVDALSRTQDKDHVDSIDDKDMLPFKSGEFVVMKSDLSEEYPPIWRIDGKTLLQKYEPFDQSGKTLYRNISTYSGWTSQNRHIYQQVPVKFRVHNRLETIVEFMRDELSVEGQEFIDKSMKEMAKYQDNFEVYIQTLISQALDSNFLTEIFQEQDDYFLSNVKTVDELTEERKQRLLNIAQWKGDLQMSVGTWPCFNVITELEAEETKEKLCMACEKCNISVRVQMYGQPYNSTTLEGSQPDANMAHLKDFLLCMVCTDRVEMYNKVAHQKYLMFLECAKRVAEKRSGDPYKDTTIILNELLADETWLNQLFCSVRTSWAEIDKLYHQASSSKISTNS